MQVGVHGLNGAHAHSHAALEVTLPIPESVTFHHLCMAVKTAAGRTGKWQTATWTDVKVNIYRPGITCRLQRPCLCCPWPWCQCFPQAAEALPPLPLALMPMFPAGCRGIASVAPGLGANVSHPF